MNLIIFIKKKKTVIDFDQKNLAIVDQKWTWQTSKKIKPELASTKNNLDHCWLKNIINR